MNAFTKHIRSKVSIIIKTLLLLFIIWSLVSLETLILLNNNLKFIDVNVFVSTPRLAVLNILGNPLKSLPEHLIEGLTSLTELHIDCSIDKTYSGIDPSLGPLVFSKLPSLSTVILRNCYNRKVPVTSLNNSAVTMITESFTANRTNNFSPLVLANLSSLKFVTLSSNHFDELSDILFANVTILELNLMGNNIKALSKKFFDSLKSLEALDLSINQITLIEDGIFSNMRALRMLNMSYNAIGNLTLNVFDGLQNLQQLYLQNNNIMEFDMRSFIWCRSSPFQHLPNLLKLNLSNNKLSTLCESLISEMPLIQMMNFTNNRFQEVPGLYNLEMKNIVIDFSENNISYVSPQKNIDGGNLNFTTILLNHNPIACDCHNYQLLRTIKDVGSRGQLKYILGHSKCSEPSNLKGKLVTELSLSDLVCNFTACPDNCTCIRRPASDDIILNCYTPPIFLDRYFNELSHMISYILNLKIPTHCLENLPIRTLNISHSGLRDIQFEPNSLLRTLDVSNNNLTTIPKKFIDSNITLHVAGNPLDCDCVLVKGLEKHRVADYELVYCKDGSRLSEIDVTRLCMWNTILMGYIVMGIIAGIFLIKIGITVRRYMKRKQMNVSDLILRRGSKFSVQLERVLDAAKEYDIFISFAHEDTAFVQDNLLPKLEHKFGQKVCVHHRDWIAGELIDDQIIQSVESSRRTLIVLTESFILSEWSYLEFRTAHNMSIREGKPRVIIILLNEDIVNDTRLNKDIKSYICVNTYLVWGDPDFWNKLKRILPKHSRR